MGLRASAARSASEHGRPYCAATPREQPFLTRGGTLWSWPGNNPMRWRDPSGRLGVSPAQEEAALAALEAAGELGAGSLAAGAAVVGIAGYAGWNIYNQFHDFYDPIITHAAKARENQGRPDPGTPCRTEAGGGGDRGRAPPPTAAAADDEEPQGDPRLNPQKQAGHMRGTPQWLNRVRAGKVTSTFFSAEQGEALTREAWANGTPLSENMRLYEFGRPVGYGPDGGGYQTQIRVSIDQAGTIHGSPWGPVFQGPVPQ